MMNYQDEYSQEKYSKFIQTGTASSNASVDMGSSLPSNQFHVFFLKNITPIPTIFVKDKPQNKKVDREAFLEMANRAYAALKEEDRDEMDIWDSTINDGLDDDE